MRSILPSDGAVQKQPVFRLQEWGYIVVASPMVFSKKILSAGLWLSAGILAGRLAGLVRESTLAAKFGLGPLADAAALIVTIPDLFANLLAGGAISAVLVPELIRRDPALARRLFCQVAVVALLGFLALTLSLQLGVHSLLTLLAPGFTGHGTAQAADGVRIALWAIVPTVLAGVVTAYLNSRQHFAVPAFGTLIYNVTIIASLFLGGAGTSPLTLLGWAIVAGALLRLAAQTVTLPGGTLALRNGPNLVERELMAHYFRAMAAGILPVLLPALVRALASLEGLGGLAAVNYATKLVELPLGLCITVLSAVLFPKMAELLSDRNRQAESDHLLRTGISAALALSYATLLPLAWFNRTVTTFIFGRGEMSPADLLAIGTLAAIGLWSLPAQAISSLLTANFNARRDTVAPLWINGAGLAATAVLAFLAVRLGDLRSLMLAVVAGSCLTVIAQLVTLKARHGVNLRHALLHGENFRGLGAAVAAFLPFVALDRALQPEGLAALALAGLTGLALLAATVFVSPGLRRAAASGTPS